MKINRFTLRRYLWLWLFTFFALEAGGQQFSGGMQTGVLRIKVKPQLVQAKPEGLKTKMLNNVAVTGIKALDALSEQYDVKSIERVFRYSPANEAKHQKYGLHLWYTVTFNAKTSPKQLSTAYAQLNEIERAEPVLEKSVIPYTLTELKASANKAVSALPFNDTHLDKQWHYDNSGQNGGTPGSDINLFNAWKSVAGNRKVIVSIHDTGLDITHEDLMDNLWINETELNGKPTVDDDNNGYRDDVYGYNFADNSATIAKGDHGTHVAGTIAAVNNNGKGVSGIAGGSGNHDGVRLMACQIMGGTWTDLIAESYIYAADNGAIISQNSWGYSNPYSYEQIVLDAIDYFIAEAGSYSGSPMKGGIVIFASGNSSTDLLMYPGAYDHVIAVSAIGPRFEYAPYSNFGDWIDISAPGGNGDWGVASSVLSTIPNGKYGYMDGTSMACPHVSGVAALVVSRHGGANYTNETLKKALLTGISNKIYEAESNASYKNLLGTGMTDAVKAIATDQKKAPDAITSLVLKGIAQDFANIQWLVPVDEDDAEPVEFEILYSTKPLTASNVASAKSMKVKNDQPAGTEIEVEINSLLGLTTYYFYVRSIDRWGNVSLLSNEVTGNTNRGPKIKTNVQSLSTTIDVATATEGTVLFNILNEDEGLLKWNGEIRHISSADYNRSSFQYPIAGVNNSRPQLGKLQFEADQKDSLKSPVTPYAQEPESKEFLYFNQFAGMFVIGEQNLKLTNSMASKFVVTSPEGFNLTNAQFLLKHDNTTGPAIFEVRVGETLNDAKITYIEERKSAKAESSYHSFALKEQIFFPQGTTFWLVVHVPSGNLYPLGSALELEKDLSNNCFYSSNMGQTWNRLEDVYYENRLVWTLRPQQKLKSMGEYITLLPDNGDVEFNNSMEVKAHVDASEIVNGTYKANILLNSNDKDQPILRIPYKLEVRGHKPKFDLPEIVDMGSCLLGQSITKTIELNNTGLGAMASPTIKLSNPLFKIDGMKPSVISAKSTQTLTIKFKPDVSGNQNCILTISDSKGNSFTTNLFAVTAEPPVITITPQTINHAGLHIGDQVDGTFNISNTGKYPLKYYFPYFANAQTDQTAIDKYEHFFGYQHVITNEEDQLAWKDISTTGTDHASTLRNMHNVYVPVDLGFGFPFFGKEEHTGYLTRYGIFAFDETSSFNVQPMTFKQVESNDRFISALGMGLKISDQTHIYTQRFSDQLIIQYQDCGIQQENWMTGEMDIVPVTFQIILFDNGDIEYKYKNVNAIDEDLRSEELFLAIEDQSLSDGLCINDHNYQKLLIEDNVKVHITNAGYGAVEILNNAKGTLMVGQSTTINYTVNTNKLSQGSFTEKVAILSNDPANPNAYAQFDIEIVDGGTPDVNANVEELDFGKNFQGSTKSLIVEIVNSGNASVEINNIGLNTDRFTASIDEFPYDLKYRHTLYLIVEFNTDLIGTFDDLLTINIGGNQTIEIPLMGEITPAPSISASLDAISESLAAGQSKQLQMTISNNGGYDLEVSPKGNEWLVITEAVPSDNESVDYSLSSNENGATDALYNWMNILDGQKFPLAESPDEYLNEVQLPWEISFYGKKYSKFYVAFNGVIFFDKVEYQDVFYFGQELYAPNPNLPNNYLAACWGYLGPVYQETPGKEGFYFKAVDDMIIVSFEDYINGFGMGDPMSAQVIFYKNGNIKFQYKIGYMDWTASRTGICVENADGTKGVQISYYEENHIKDKSAYILSPSNRLTIAPNASADFNITVDASSLIAGNYQGQLQLSNNTPAQSNYAIAAQLEVTGEAIISTVDAIDLGEITIREVLDQYGNLIYQPYAKEFELTNTGKGALEINQIVMQNAEQMATSSWMNIYINGQWGGEFEWVMTDDPWSVSYPMVLLPGESISLRAQVNPTEQHSLIEDNLIIESNLGQLAIPLTANAILPPALSVDSEGITVVANNMDFKESRPFTISNANGQSELKVNCLLAFDRAEATPTSAKPQNKNAMPLADKQARATELKMVQASGRKATSAKPYDSSQERFLYHTDNEKAENYIGFGGGVVFEGATGFKAPNNGFNLTDVMTYMRIEENTNIQLVVTILTGKEINSAKTLFTQTFEINNEGDDIKNGNLKRLKLSENQIMLPGEVFYIVFSYPSEIKYPQGIVDTTNKLGNHHFYYDTNNGRWADFNAITEFASKAFLTKAVEAEYKNAAWVELNGETSLTIPAGEEKTITLDFIGGYAQGAVNVANLVINSNDKKNEEVEVPVRMLMNQAPIFETGKECYFNIKENEMLDVTTSISDAENDAFAISTNNTIVGLTATPSANQLIISYRPTFNDAGSYQFTATATDEHGNASECIVHIEVAQTNRAPQVIANIANKIYSLEEDKDLIAFETVFTDPDADPLTFKVTSSTEAIVECFASEYSMFVQPLSIGTTTLTITATDSENMSASTSFDVEVKNRVGIDELINAEIKIYPIPAKDYVNIQWSQLIPGNIIVKLNGADGKLLMQKTVETSTFAGEIQISLSEYSSGIYFIELVSEGESITKQILKK